TSRCPPAGGRPPPPPPLRGTPPPPPPPPRGARGAGAARRDRAAGRAGWGVRGRRARDASGRRGLERGLEVHTSRVEYSGPIAYSIGRWFLPATAEEAADSGKLVLCWKRGGRSWMLTADIS